MSVFVGMKDVFVFGSNEGGFHGAGSALEAMKNHGAIYGKGWGLHGDSFAIPTKDHAFRVLPINQIADYVFRFVRFAKANPGMRFNIVAIGCGLAGFKPEQIAPMFKDAPHNCNLPKEFLEVLNAEKN